MNFLGSNLIILVGPTAVGKTKLSIDLAKKYEAEIFSADSRQLYREMSIGTAKPTSKEMSGVIHHFVDSHSIQELYSAGDFERDVEQKLNEYFTENKTAILSGGTGLFVRAVTHGMDDMPETSEKLRADLMTRLKNEGLESLQQQLSELDPVIYTQMDIQNSQRVVRALEVCLSTGKPFSSFLEGKEKSSGYHLIKIGLERPREELYDRINKRVDLMLDQGLVNEVKSLTEFRNKNALQTVGYKEVFQYLDREIDYKEMVELIKRNSRRYAKRQLTWFKNKDNFKWFQADDFEGICHWIDSQIL